jgi:protein O-mannosyl-transferase
MAKPQRKSEPNRSQPFWLFSLILIAATALAYFPAWTGKPIWDDNMHMTPPGLRSWHGLVEIWTRLSATPQYYPLVHTVFWIEQKLWGDSMLGYHLVNVLLHALSAIVLLQILTRLKIPGAWLAAGLFALHPVQVETVAWVSELKNTLSGIFFFCSILTYLNFDETREPNSYLGSLVFFVFGLLCKTVIAPLPAIILVLLWWKRGQLRVRHDVTPLLPLFAIGMAAGLFTAWVERNVIGAQGPNFQLSIWQRCFIATRDFWFYLFKLFWPAKLTFIYPRWQTDAQYWWQFVFPLALLLLLALILALRKKLRGPLAATLIFLGLLFPSLGFINVYPFIYSFVADHFQYLACVGPLALFAVTLTIALKSVAPRITVLQPAISGALLLTLGALSWHQCRDYKDLETLWRTTLARNPDCWMAYSNLGSLLLTRGNVDDAISDFRKALELWPEQSKDHNNLGNALAKKGRMAEAIEQFQTALRISPDDPDAEMNLGAALLQQGETDQAISHLERAVQEFPSSAEAHINLGNALLQQRDADGAIAEYRKTLELPFDHAESYYGIGNAYRQKGDIEEAIVQYRKAIEVRADDPNTHNNLGNALRQEGRLEEAEREYEAALASRPNFVVAGNNLAWVLATADDPKLRNGAKAVHLAEQAVAATDGNNPVFLQTLSAAYAENGDFEKAITAAQNALEIAEGNGISDLAESLRTKIALYQSGSAYREPLATPQ